MSEHDRPSESELARLRASFISAEPGAGAADNADDAVEPELIWAAARGQLDPEQTAAIVDRLHDDPQLMLEWRLALELASDEPATDHRSQADPEHEPRPANDRRYWHPGLLVAIAVAAVAVVVLRGRHPDSDRSPAPDPTVDPVVRGSTTTLSTDVAEGAVVSREGFELSWSAVAGAARYELRLHTEALDPVYDAFELGEPHARIPPEALAKLDAGVGLVWQVTAVMSNGERIAGPLWRVDLE